MRRQNKLETTTKFIIINGGVISGVGKGLIATSTALILKSMGHTVTFIKIDPYLNTDAGNLSPLDHGEVFVLNDGGEVDLDFGNYERFANINLTSKHSITAGKVYSRIVEKERNGDYLGETVRSVPHLTDYVQDCIIESSQLLIKNGTEMIKPEICIVELGGTVGDIEASIFIEALRQLKMKLRPEDFVVISVEYVPFTFELKTKPIQESAKKMRQLGIKADIIIARCNKSIDAIKSKISCYSEIENEFILHCPDLDSIYDVPEFLKKQRLFEALAKLLKIEKKCELGLDADIKKMGAFFGSKIVVGIVGKYSSLQDAYLSISNALTISGVDIGVGVEIKWIQATKLEDGVEEAWNDLKICSCIVVAGGFGVRGSEGKINALKYARENKLPCLGICFGFQLAVIEFARNVLKIESATSEEFFADAENKIIKIVQKNGSKIYGGDMRLGASRVNFIKDSRFNSIYKKESVEERHRHRYEVNPDFKSSLEQNGMFFSGLSECGLSEAFELEDHPFYFGTQYHPEFIARPAKPHCLFTALLKAALAEKK